MKTMRLLLPMQHGFTAISLLLASALGSLAQTGTPPPIPVVTIQATVPVATWAGQAGVFTVFRAGDPAPDLNIYYCVGGTASNGVDYQAIGHFVELPGGVTSNTIVINPINLGQSKIETVIVDFCPSPMMNPVNMPINYIIGSPTNATVYITPSKRTHRSEERRVREK